MAAVGTLTYEFQITLPLVAQDTFGVGAGGYGLLTSMMGAGAVVGGLVVANRGRPSRRRLGIAGIGFGSLVLLASVMPTFGSMLVVLPLVGAASITFIALANTNLQLLATPAMRGRVMALYSVAFMGSTPVGGPIVGLVGQALGARSALLLGGVTAVGASLLAWRSLNRPAPMTLTDADVAAAELIARRQAEMLDDEKAQGAPEPALALAS
jgi:predicted MFS family arabinose efflux permease